MNTGTNTQEHTQFRLNRIAANVTQGEVARKIGVSNAALSQWEVHGVPLPDAAYKELRKLAKACGRAI